jgi:parvulin-like peptidyl-prolyl isomerase
MIPATILAAFLASPGMSATPATPPAPAAPAKADAPSVSVFLKAAAAKAPSCRTTPVDDKLVRAPLFSPDSASCPVANVAGDVIALRELAGALEVGHLTRSPRTAAPAKRPDMDFTPALDRLITTRLLVLEAREMRLDQTPDFRAEVDKFKASRERTMLQQTAVKGVKPDPAEVERLYREAVREWKLKSVLLEKEADAKAFEAALKAGGSFDAVTKKFVAEKKAKGGGKAEFVSPKHMLPEVRQAVEHAKPGVPTGLVKVASGWIVLRVDGTRYPPNNAKARADARATSLARKEREAVRNYYLSLVKKYATVDEPLLKSIDFEANGEKGFDALLKDERPLVKIAGEKPITVGDLTREVALKFFHGIASPIEQKRVNPHKAESFERLVGSRLFAREAAARNLDQRPEHRREVEAYERALAFSLFMEKVVKPEVKVTEDDAMRHYEQHKADFTAPEMFKLDGIAFASPREAQAALEKLKGGTDFSWLRSTAPNQLAPERRSLQFDGSTVSASTLPRELAQALTNASTGAYRLYSRRDGEVYVVRVVDQRAPAVQPYAEAREEIAKKLFNEKLMQGMKEYAAKLRKAQPVEVLITRVAT